MQTFSHELKKSKEFENSQQEIVEDIKRLDSTDFVDSALKASGPVAVEFMSYGCEHCRALEPVLQKVAKMVQSKQKIFRVNVEVEPELAKSYDIQGTPTLVMFLNGKEVGRAEGPNPTVSSLMTALSKGFGV